MKRHQYLITLVLLTAIIMQSCMHKIASVPIHENDTCNISQDISSKIKMAYFESEHSISQAVNRIWISRYYGNYNGCEIVFLNEGATPKDSRSYGAVERHVKLAGYELVFPSEQLLLVYKDGKIYTLTDAYEDKLIDGDDIYEIGIKLSLGYAEENYQIILNTKELYEDLKNSENDNLIDEFIGFEDFGTYGECNLMYVDDVFFNDVEFEFWVAGYKIIIPDNRILSAYKEGVFYTLAEAYENGFISKDDIYEIGAKADTTFKERYPVFITE